MGRGADLGPCQHAQAGYCAQMSSHEEPCMPTAGGVGPSAHARTRLLTPCNAPTALQEAGPPWLPSPFQPEYLGDPHPSLRLSFLREGPSSWGGREKTVLHEPSAPPKRKKQFCRGISCAAARHRSVFAFLRARGPSGVLGPRPDRPPWEQPGEQALQHPLSCAASLSGGFLLGAG